MPLSTLILLIALAVFAAALASLAAAVERRRVTVWEWQVGLLFVNGQFVRTLPPGRYLAGFGGREVHRIATTPRQFSVPAQEALTSDGFPVKLTGVVEWRVADARAFLAACNGNTVIVPEALYLATQLALRDAVTGRALDDLLALRSAGAALDAELRPPVEAAAAGIGAEIIRVVLRDVILPAEVRRMTTEVERARREGLAALERARGEQAALRSLANAARMLRGNPELQTLRTLQALTPAQGRAAPTLVLGAGAVLPVRADADPAPDVESDPA